MGQKRRALLFFEIAIASWEAPWEFPEQSLGGRRALALRMQTSNVSEYFMTSYLSKCRLRGTCYIVRLLAALLMRLLIYEPSRSFARLPEACRQLPRVSQSLWRLPETGASRKVPEACRELVGARNPARETRSLRAASFAARPTRKTWSRRSCELVWIKAKLTEHRVGPAFARNFRGSVSSSASSRAQLRCV